MLTGSELEVGTALEPCTKTIQEANFQSQNTEIVLHDIPDFNVGEPPESLEPYP